jgi:hypothetical protein
MLNSTLTELTKLQIYNISFISMHRVGVRFNNIVENYSNRTKKIMQGSISMS